MGRFVKAQNTLLETYLFGDYIIEVCKEGTDWLETFGAYLQREDYDVKSYIFGIPTSDITLEEFVKLVEANIEDYIHSYNEDYC